MERDQTLNEQLAELQKDPRHSQAVANLKSANVLQTAEELKTCAVVVRQLVREHHDRKETKEYLTKLIAKAEQLKRRL